MKKFVLLLFVLLLVTGCNARPKIDFNQNFSIETYKADMSGYDGLKSVGHRFLGTTVSQLKKTVDEKGYGIFVLSRTDCPHCQQLMKLMNQVAEEYDTYIYYINALSDKYPILDTDDYELLYDLMWDAMDKIDGVKQLQTPTLFTIIDGKVVSYKVGATWKGLDYEQSDIDNILKIYREMMEPFKK